VTANKNLKRQVRARAAKTGESYTAALRHVRPPAPVSQAPAAETPASKTAAGQTAAGQTAEATGPAAGGCGWRWRRPPPRATRATTRPCGRPGPSCAG
jgi:hypothetical protein